MGTPWRASIPIHNTSRLGGQQAATAAATTTYGTESAAPGAAAIRATTVEATKRSFMLGDSVLCVSFMNAEIGLLGTVNCKRNRFVPFWVIIFYPPKKLRVKVR